MVNFRMRTMEEEAWLWSFESSNEIRMPLSQHMEEARLLGAKLHCIFGWVSQRKKGMASNFLGDSSARFVFPLARDRKKAFFFSCDILFGLLDLFILLLEFVYGR